MIKEIKLFDRADGVKGHFCVGFVDNKGYANYWNPTGYAGHGYLFEDQTIAQALVDVLNETENLKHIVSTQKIEIEKLNMNWII